MRRSNNTQNNPWSFALILVAIALVVTFFGDRLFPDRRMITVRETGFFFFRAIR